MKGLTPRQREVLRFIIGYIRSHAYPPAIREVGDHFGISVKGAYDHLDALRKKGFVRMGDRRSRAIEVLKTDWDTKTIDTPPVIEVPLLGTVAAGRPILSEENWEGSVPLHRSMLKKGAQYFALKVSGDSMTRADILEGDIAVIEKQEHAENGEIVVALVNEAMTLKRFFKEANRFRLQPESDNPENKPIYTQDVRIAGRLAHIIRSY
jgi:repressor LexA